MSATILALDPGTTETAWIHWDGRQILRMGYFLNEDLLGLLNAVAFVRGSRLLCRPSEKDQAAAEAILLCQQGSIRSKSKEVEDEKQKPHAGISSLNAQSSPSRGMGLEEKEQASTRQIDAPIQEAAPTDNPKIGTETQAPIRVQGAIQPLPQIVAHEECSQAPTILSRTPSQESQDTKHIDRQSNCATADKAGGKMFLLQHQKDGEQRERPCGSQSLIDARWEKSPPEYRNRVRSVQPAKGINDGKEISLAVEGIASYGMSVGQEVFNTCIWIGRFIEAWSSAGGSYELVYRLHIKQHLCHDSRAKDANIRQALIDRLGPPGVKKTPGVTYGVSKHLWAALAVAVYAFDRNNTPPNQT